MELQLELDRSIGDGPPLAAPTAHLRRGQQALRRRRLRAGAGALAMLVVVGGGYAVLDDVPSDDHTGVAKGEDAPLDEFLDEVPYGLVDSCDGDPSPACVPMPVAFTDQGELRRLRGTRIVSLALDPALRGEVTKSAGVDVVFEGERLWLALQWSRGGASDGREPADTSGLTFEEWLALPGTFGGVFETAPVDVEVLRWWNARTGSFEVPDGVKVIVRVDDPVGDDVAVDSAGLVFEFRGRRYWTLTTRIPAHGSDAVDGEVRVAGVTVGAVTGSDLTSAFNDWLRVQAAEQRAELQSP